MMKSNKKLQKIGKWALIGVFFSSSFISGFLVNYQFKKQDTVKTNVIKTKETKIKKDPFVQNNKIYYYSDIHKEINWQNFYKILDYRQTENNFIVSKINEDELNPLLKEAVKAGVKKVFSPFSEKAKHNGKIYYKINQNQESINVVATWHDPDDDQNYYDAFVVNFSSDNKK